MGVGVKGEWDDMLRRLRDVCSIVSGLLLGMRIVRTPPPLATLEREEYGERGVWRERSVGSTSTTVRDAHEFEGRNQAANAPPPHMLVSSPLYAS